MCFGNSSFKKRPAGGPASLSRTNRVALRSRGSLLDADDCIILVEIVLGDDFLEHAAVAPGVLEGAVMVVELFRADIETGVRKEALTRMAPLLAVVPREGMVPGVEIPVIPRFPLVRPVQDREGVEMQHSTDILEHLELEVLATDNNLTAVSDGCENLSHRYAPDFVMR